MRQLIFTALLLVMTLSAYAQQEITKFMGIPVDGKKNDMIKKLENKGFVYDYRNDYLTGEFNGYDVEVHIFTNNNKVYRICLVDRSWLNEFDIKIRFNDLCSQFEKSGRYMPVDLINDNHLTDDDDISFQIQVENKRIEADYCQIDSYDKVVNFMTNYKYDFSPNIADTTKWVADFYSIYLEHFSKRLVWFMIADQNNKYKILMFYDNLYNQANGEDL
ncbi:MAG: hypothetical protein PUC50_03525 [Bacteroidales bacterium]|nr:hypothetical protein [Bacteroidales bacterium]